MNTLLIINVFVCSISLGCISGNDKDIGIQTISVFLAMMQFVIW